ncbi:MAG: efflux RND transporter periplasmic adaptor subunit [Campylobacter sp.]|uniref:efflux RND transporter periplasmic adaptor subunit n=1 Tax=Campylobacter sp. TaxID=205 RepID=UPI001B008200|nr:efflux RND transporter periplasmic adaptor subunit [Campylobacter sp.]MBO5063944.1 efflux RND transporter periplasmic adaptor subunit [Campylobacter sp.]MBQ8609992.1 efflux RND transporter periplasmic adaptor subunit [Campylobacter sp.]
MKISKKLLIITGLIAISGAVLWWGLKEDEPKDEYITTVVKRGDIIQSVDAVGEVFASNLVDVGAQVSGQIKELYVKVGDKVKAGDKIAQIDSIKQQNTLDQQLAALEILEAKLNSAKISADIALKQYKREQNLAKQNATSQESLENAKDNYSLKLATLKEIQAQIKQTGIEINTAKTNLGYTDIRAPFDGVVVSVPVEVGQTINANQTTPTLVNIADLSKMEIRLQVSEGDIPNIKVGNRVEYSILSNNFKKYNAQISSIDPGLTTLSDGKYSTSNSNSSSTSSSSAVYYYAKVNVDNSDETLRIGMTTENKIIIAENKDVLYLPTMAIKSDKNGKFVFIKNQEEIEQRAITTGITNGINTQIVSGLSEGEEVIYFHLNSASMQNMISNSRRPMMRL